MNTQQESKLVRPRVFYTGLAIAAALLVIDFLLLVRAQGTTRQLEIYAVLFTLATLSVVYRYSSANPQLKQLGARGVWGLVAILTCAAVVFLTQMPAGRQNQRPAPAAAGAARPPGDSPAPDSSAPQEKASPGAVPTDRGDSSSD